MRSGSLVSFKGGSLCPDVAKTSCSSSLCLTNIEVFLVILIFILVLATNEGRSKLLMALTLSTDSSLRFHYEALGEKGPAKGAGKGKDAPVGRTDNSTSTEPTYTMPSDPTTDSAKLSVELHYLPPLQLVPPRYLPALHRGPLPQLPLAQAIRPGQNWTLSTILPRRFHWTPRRFQ